MSDDMYSMVPTDFSKNELAELDSLSESTTYLQRIQLYSKGKAVDRKLVPGGHFGVPIDKDEILDLGDSIDVIPLARRAKAIDMSDRENIMTSYDINSEVFKDIRSRAAVKDSGCQFGVSYLFFERSTSKFYEFFCGTTSAKRESSKINNYLPAFMGGKEEKSRPMTVVAKWCEKGDWSWFAPQVKDCNTPFDEESVPELKIFQEQIAKFLSPEEEAAEVKDEDTGGRAR